MKTRKVKIHSKEWFEKNCEKLTSASYPDYCFYRINGDADTLESSSDIIGCVIDVFWDEDTSIWLTLDKEENIVADWMIEEDIQDIKPTTKESLQKLVGDLTSKINSIESNIEEGDFFQMGKCDALKCVIDKLAFIILNDTEDGNSNN